MVNKRSHMHASASENRPDILKQIERLPEAKYRSIAKHKKTLFKDINSYSNPCRAQNIVLFVYWY